MKAAMVRLADDVVNLVLDHRPRIDTPGRVRIVWLPDSTPDIEEPVPLATLTAGLTQFDVGGEEAWATEEAELGTLKDLQDREALKSGYLAVLADLDTIEAAADEEIVNMTAIINAMPNPTPGIQTAVKQLAVTQRRHLQGTKLNVQNARKTLKGLRQIVG